MKGLNFYYAKNRRLNEFKKSLKTDTNAWKEFYDISNPNDHPCPAPLDDLHGLYRLIILRCIRPDKVVPAVAVS